MKKQLFLLALLLFTACQSVDENRISNEAYDFSFALPEGWEIYSENPIEDDESFTAEYHYSIASTELIQLWPAISIYKKDADPQILKEIKEGPQLYEIKVLPSQDQKMWRTEPMQGAADYWFMSSILEGSNYFYVLETSGPDMDSFHMQTHELLFDSFKADQNLLD